MCVRKLLKVSGKTFLGSVMVNCKCQFEWVVGCPDEALSLGMPVRLFLSEVNMSVCGFRTSRLPSPMCLGIIQFWGAWLEQKRVEAGINPFFPASLLELECLISSSLALRCWLRGCSGLGTWPESHHCLSSVSSLQTADCGTSQPPWMQEPSPCNKSPFVACWFCLSGEP